MASVIWMYFGNVGEINGHPTSTGWNQPARNATQQEVNSSGIVGSTYGGPTELSPISVTGIPVTTSNPAGHHFNTIYSSYQTSMMSYTKPAFAGGMSVPSTSISTFLSATFDVTIEDADGNQTTVAKTGVILQMRNGDLFMRPSLDEVPNWSDVQNLVKFTVTSAAPFPTTTHPATISFNPDIWEIPIICFARGTTIATGRGEVAVEDLRPGDLVMTRDDGLQPIRWIGATGVSAARLDLVPALRPIRIRAGALDAGVPARDLVVSPQHRVLIGSRIARRMFGADEVLVAARHLLAIDGIEVARDLTEVEYFHLLLDRHQIVTSNGAATESLYLGPEARKAVGRRAWHEIRALFPDLTEDALAASRARDFVPGRKGRRLAARQARNRQPLAAH